MTHDVLLMINAVTDMTLFCSRQELSDGARHGTAGAGRVVLNGVDLAAFTPITPGERQAARQSVRAEFRSAGPRPDG